MVCLHFTMLPAFIYLAIDYDARRVGEKNSELVSVKLAVSCYSIRPRGVKLQLHQQQTRCWVSNIKIFLIRKCFDDLKNIPLAHTYASVYTHARLLHILLLHIRLVSTSCL